MSAERKEYPEREIYAYGRYIQCQILNWSEGPPPRYIICNPLDKDYRETFLARQGMGTWMRCDLREATAHIESLEAALTAAKEENERLVKALADIRRKVHAHNRGGGLRLSLRMEIRDIADAALAPPQTDRRGP